MALILEYRGKKPFIHESAFVAPNATLIGDVEIGEFASVWFNVVLRGDTNHIHVGNYSNIQENVVIHPAPNPAMIGDHVSVTHGSIVEGCVIGDNSMIGLRSIVMEGAQIGRNCLIGAGAVVLNSQSIPENSIAVGSPAKVIKKMEKSHLEYVSKAWKKYRDRSRKYIQLLESHSMR